MSTPKGPAPQPTVLRLLRGNPGRKTPFRTITGTSRRPCLAALRIRKIAPIHRTVI
jgi:hypothetical protein